MDKKIIILFLIVGTCFVLAGPAFAKETVKIDITAEDYGIANNGYIVIKLVDSDGNPINTNGKINYTITDEYGNYKWTYKSYNGEIRLKYPDGKYKVEVKFDGTSKYKSARITQFINVKSSVFDPYTYYEDHNWGLDQEMDDYFDYNYWDEEIYDDASNYDGEWY
ncbi:hypothetical protein [Methanobrevibacter sp.]|uniref:hypothetical protein n=1 Tax=Methanobrevibacter sp. TaxID=66852 RepID=UPI0025CE98CF|nr:hypothetical protein [Methanobrevibacter sp.]MBQ2831809.1 hypothetical protein [Methanobrevibacter sp.]